MSNDKLQIIRGELPTLVKILGLVSRPGIDVEALALEEIQHFQSICVLKPSLLECEIESIKSAFRAVLKNNLSFDPNAGLVYLKPRNIQVGDNWVKILEYTPSCEGIISISRQCGRLLDIDRPTVIKNEKGRVIKVEVKYLKPSKNEMMQDIAKTEIVEFDESDFKRWATASHKENSKYYKENKGKPKPDPETLNYANVLYTSFNGGIDPEFARAKSIRHALRKKGTNQNEILIKAIVSPIQKMVINKDADMRATYDDEGMEYQEADIMVGDSTDGDLLTPKIDENEYNDL